MALSGTASDNVAVTSVTWVNDRGGSGTATGTTSWSEAGVNLFEGVNVITVTAHDAALNTGTDVITVTLDTTNPVCTITTPTPNPTFLVQGPNPQIQLGGTASDANGIESLFWFSDLLNHFGSCIGTDNWVTDALELVQGVNTITVSAIDNAGNVGTDTIIVTYNVLQQSNAGISFGIRSPVALRYR